jgi:hypothetical protein
MDTYDSDRSWEKCARLLMTNDIKVLDDMLHLIRIITNNIILHPNEVKYRTLQAKKSQVKSKIIDVSGGVEYLSAVGFRAAVDEVGSRIFQYLDCPGTEQESAKDLLIGLEWLENTIKTCEGFSKLNLGRMCCQCLVNIKLPTGTTICGGFLAGDTLRDVLNFAKSCFVREK